MSLAPSCHGTKATISVQTSCMYSFIAQLNFAPGMLSSVSSIISPSFLAVYHFINSHYRFIFCQTCKQIAMLKTTSNTFLHDITLDHCYCGYCQYFVFHMKANNMLMWAFLTVKMPSRRLPESRMSRYNISINN